MLITDMPFIMARCLIGTLVIEIIVGIVIGIRDKKDILNVGLVNIFTNPLVSSIPVLIYFYCGYTLEIISLVILEIFAFVSEGFIYSKVLKYKKINPYLVSLILNLSSYIIGVIINSIK